MRQAPQSPDTAIHLFAYFRPMFITTPHDFLFHMYHSDANPQKGGRNFTYYSNPEYDKLAEKQRTQLDREERRKTAFEMQKIIDRDQPQAFLVHPKYALAFNKAIFKEDTVVNQSGIGIRNIWTFLAIQPLGTQKDLIINSNEVINATNPLYIGGAVDSWVTDLIWDRIMRIGPDGKLLMTEEQAMQVAQEFGARVQEKKMKEAQELGKKNLAEGEKFLAENAKKPGVKTTPSGLQYQVMTEGKGPKPTAEDTVRVHYKGTLLDGKTFDSSIDRGEPVVFGEPRVGGRGLLHDHPNRRRLRRPRTFRRRP